MTALPTVIAVGAALLAQAAFAESAKPDVATLAQAHDRCMTTYAVRMLQTDATDDVIFASASEGCKRLEDQLYAAIDGEYPPNQAGELKGMLDAEAKPAFLKLLQQIRASGQINGGGK